MKIVLIGAGSRSFGFGQIKDILMSRELRGRDVILSLVDENEHALELMTNLALKIKDHTGTDVKIEKSGDRRKALPGANCIITAVARKRMELWEQDFRIPLSYGFRHSIGENAGPGALFHTLRSLELMIPICRDIEALCPEALLLNYTNPEARVLHAICHLTKVNSAGLCHGVFYALDLISRYFQRPIDEFDVASAGINHFYCILKLVDKKTGKDLLPEAVNMAMHDRSAICPPLFRKMAEIFGIFTFPSDEHIGEFFSYGSEFTGVKWPYGLEKKQFKLEETEPPGLPLEEYLSGKRALDQDLVKPSGEMSVPIICDILLDRKAWRPAVNVMNRELFIENLPATGIVEVPAIVDGKGIHPQSVGALPEPFAAMIRTHLAINELITEAYRTRSKKILLQALLIDPVVNSVSAAEKMLDEMLELQKDFLPCFE